MAERSIRRYQKWDETRFHGSPVVMGMSPECALIYRVMLQVAFVFGEEGLPADQRTLVRVLRIPLRYFKRHAGGALAEFREIDGRLFWGNEL